MLLLIEREARRDELKEIKALGEERNRKGWKYLEWSFKIRGERLLSLLETFRLFRCFRIPRVERRLFKRKFHQIFLDQL